MINTIPDDKFIHYPQCNDQYKFGFLSNGIKVLMIYSPLIVETSVMFTINCGSSNDPDKFLGMAHLMEHVTFNGSNKYPDPGEIGIFCSKNNVEYNAQTDKTHTRIWFKTKETHNINQLMDMFVDAIFYPLIQRDAAKNEIGVINSECESFMNNVKLNELTLHYLFAQHTLYGRFAIGNNETLKNITPDKIKAFHKKYYVPNNCTIIIQHNQHFPITEKIVFQYCNRVESRDNNEPQLGENSKDSKFSNIFDVTTNKGVDTYASIIIGKDPISGSGLLKSFKNHNKLMLYFPLSFNKYHFHQYHIINMISHIVQSMSPTGFKNQLMRNGLITNMEVDVDSIGKKGLFILYFDLTKKGDQRRTLIIRECINYINSIAITPEYYAEYYSQQSFLFNTFLPTYSLIELLEVAENVDYMESEYFIVGEKYMSEYYDGLEEIIINVRNSFVEHIEPNNTYVVIIDNDLSDDMLAETLYGNMKYKFVDSIDDDNESEALVLETDPLRALKLYSIKLEQNMALTCPIKKPNGGLQELLVDKFKVWVLNDSNVPKVYVSIMYRLSFNTLEEHVRLLIYFRILDLNIAYENYSLARMGIEVVMYSYGYDLNIDIICYPSIIEQILDILNKPIDITEDQFHVVLEDLIADYENNPVNLDNAVHDCSHSGEEIINFLVNNKDKYDLSIILQDQNIVVSNPVMIIGGCCNKRMVPTILKAPGPKLTLKSEPMPCNLAEYKQIKRVPRTNIHTLLMFFPFDILDVVLRRVILFLIANVSNQEIYKAFRINSQTSYHCSIIYQRIRDNMGLLVYVKYNTETISDEDFINNVMKNFLLEFKLTLFNDYYGFDAYKRSLEIELSSSFDSFVEKFEYYRSALRGGGTIDQRENELKVLKTINSKDLLQYYNKYVMEMFIRDEYYSIVL